MSSRGGFPGLVAELDPGRTEFAAIFGGLELIEPGIVPVSEWRADPGTYLPERHDVSVWGGVARKGPKEGQLG